MPQIDLVPGLPGGIINPAVYQSIAGKRFGHLVWVASPELNGTQTDLLAADVRTSPELVEIGVPNSTANPDTGFLITGWAFDVSIPRGCPVRPA